MEKEKQENLDKAKSIWDLFHNGKSKKSISDTLKINRTEVSNVIKYTTLSMYFTPSEIEEKWEQKYEILRTKANMKLKEKNSHIKKIKNTISRLEDEIRTFKTNKLSILGKKII